MAASIKSLHEILEEIARTNINVTNTNSNFVQFHYPSGWSPRIPGGGQVFGATEFQDITLPTDEIQCQISSSSVSDAALRVRIEGYLGPNSFFEPISEEINLTANNGRTPKTLTLNYFRIKSMKVVTEDRTNAGNIFLTVDGSTTNNGYPDTQGNYLYSIQAGEKHSAILNVFIPVLEGYSLQEQYAQISLGGNSRASATVKLQYKPYTSSTWNTTFVMYRDRITATSWIRADLTGKPPLNDHTLPVGIDYRGIVFPQNADNINIAGYVSLQMFEANF